MNAIAPVLPDVGSVRGSEALARLLAYPGINRVLDVGSGAGEQAAVLRAHGKAVTTVSLEEPADIVGDFVDAAELRPYSFDAIWACHVLEHQPNVGAFLERCWKLLRFAGLLVVTVPPAKDAIVGGHLTLWNAGLLIYNLVVAGFDCREARVSGVYASGPGYPPYNISVIVAAGSSMRPKLRFDKGDIDTLADRFPLPVREGFDGNLPPIRW